MLNFEELMTKQPDEIVYILLAKINSQQNEISGLWNKIKKSRNKSFYNEYKMEATKDSTELVV